MDITWYNVSCWWVLLQAGDGKPVSDQWLPPFVVTGEDGKAVGTIEVQIHCNI